MEPFVTIGTALAGREAGTIVPLPAREHDHLDRVLRLRKGDPVELSDGAGWSAPARYEGTTATLVSGARFEPAPTPRLVVVHALPKGRKLDEVVRLLTELGVDRILPAVSERSVVRLEGERADRAAERWRAIADSAVSQSRRVWRCQLAPPRPLPDVLADLGPVRGVVAHVGAERSIGDALADLDGDVDTVAFAVGPEGGWTDDEVAGFAAAGLVPVGLGASVLRTEHAAGVLTSVGAYILGRLG